jgi:serine/threonine protein kinase
VFFLLFELADGDVRKHVVSNNCFDCVWTIRTLHHIAVGISQLHVQGIYHQDIKPSNVLVFEQQQTSKLADLGRAHCKTIEAPHDLHFIPGVRSYAPPEQLYNFQITDRDHARAASDLYLLGSMAYFLFSGVMLTPSIVSRLRPEHRPPMLAHDDGGWRGYFEDVLPFLRAAYGVDRTPWVRQINW